MTKWLKLQRRCRSILNAIGYGNNFVLYELTNRPYTRAVVSISISLPSAE
jgi:hypothetical protein